jgi:hypothetical protein
MSIVVRTLAAIVVTILAGQSVAAADTVLKVFVTAATPEPRKQVDAAMKKELESQVAAATKARKELEKELKGRYGKKEEAWPQEQQNALFDAREAEALATADYEYRRIDPEALSDTAEDLKNSLTGKGALQTKKDNVIVVNAEADADLVVEVVARRSAKTLPTQIRADLYYISFRIKAGGKLSADRFAAIPRDYRFRRFGYAAWRLQAPKPESPVWRFDAMGEQRWGNAAATASILINDFIEKSYAALTAQATAPRQ